jgi:5,10-methylenetetrahydromethanopterin reductase
MEYKRTNKQKIKFYVALRGDKKPQEYIRLAQFIERIGFERIYVYDDLMFYSSSQILALIAEHTEKIEVGPCLVNGFYRHPAIIAQEAAFLDEIAPGRTVLGTGRGAFFDFYNLNDSEEHTRKGVVETLQQVKRLLDGDRTALKGEFYDATSKAFLRVPIEGKKIPTVVGSWNPMIAKIAGQLASELQVAEVWDPVFLGELRQQMENGAKENGLPIPKFSIGGMSCISPDVEKAFALAKKTAAVYIPYLNRLIDKYGFDSNSPKFQEIFHYSRQGEYEKCASLITNDIVQRVSLAGTPEMIVEKVARIHDVCPLDGFMISPPYGTGTIEENLELIMEKIVKKLNG